MVGRSRAGAKGPESKPADVKTAEIYAILPGSDPSEAAVDFLMEESNFTGVGEKDAAAAFDERMSLLVAVAGTASEPAAAKLKTLLLAAMDAAIRQSEGGIARYSDIENGLRFAAVSDRAFPSDAAQKSARDQLRQRKAWVDTRVAILKALAAGEQWDPFIDRSVISSASIIPSKSSASCGNGRSARAHSCI